MYQNQSRSAQEYTSFWACTYFIFTSGDIIFVTPRVERKLYVTYYIYKYGVYICLRTVLHMYNTIFWPCHATRARAGSDLPFWHARRWSCGSEYQFVQMSLFLEGWCLSASWFPLPASGGEGGGWLIKNERKKSTWTTYRREFQTKNKKSNHVGRRHCLVEAGWRAEKSEKQKRKTKKTQEVCDFLCESS